MLSCELSLSNKFFLGYDLGVIKDPYDLSLKLEEISKELNVLGAKIILFPYLNSPHSVVREGAILGLQMHIEDDKSGAILKKFEELANSDSSEVIKGICKEILSYTVVPKG